MKITVLYPRKRSDKIPNPIKIFSSFDNGFCYIFKGNKIGLLTKSGRLFCTGQFDSAPGFLGADFGFVEFSMNTRIQINEVENGL